ncbi:MAG: flagellar FlbD family protein, partial [Lachnospiraceae bacterium]|nr:flagellar FlbD family protein [Lachnospiraceae bacterium]
GKKLVVKDSPEDVLSKIIEYRKKIGLVGNEH